MKYRNLYNNVLDRAGIEIKGRIFLFILGFAATLLWLNLCLFSTDISHL